MADAASKPPTLANRSPTPPKARTRAPRPAADLAALEPSGKPPSARLQQMLTQLAQAWLEAEQSDRPVRLSVVVEPGRRAPRIEVEPLTAPDDLDAALSEAHARGAARAAEILTGSDMLGADDFARLIGMTREAVRQKLMRREVLGLTGAKRGVRYPAWQVTADGGLLPGLPALFETLGDSPWTIYRFLTQPNPAFAGKPPLGALLAGRVAPVLEAAEAHAHGDFG